LARAPSPFVVARTFFFFRGGDGGIGGRGGRGVGRAS
jgi:hypothetical protein